MLFVYMPTRDYIRENKNSNIQKLTCKITSIARYKLSALLKIHTYFQNAI
jgi:hypothetical protein